MASPETLYGQRPTKDEHVYPALMQGPFPVKAITNEPFPLAVFNPEMDPQPRHSIGNAVRFLRSLSPHNRGEFREHVGEARDALGMISGMLGISNFSEIRPALNRAYSTPQLEKRMHDRVNRMFLRHYGLTELKASTAEGIIENYGKKVNEYIELLSRDPGGLLSVVASSIDFPEGVKTTNSILGLVNIVFDPGSTTRARYAAEFKLLGIKIMAEKKHDERKKKAKDTYPLFINFLNTHIWEGPTKDYSVPVELVTVHKSDDYSFVRYRFLTADDISRREESIRRRVEMAIGDRQISEGEKEEIEARVRKKAHRDEKGRYVRSTPNFSLRTFSYKGRRYKAHIQPREEKELDAFFTKVLRAGEDPGRSVRDDYGAEITFETRAAARAFVKRLQEAGAKGEILFETRERKDSLGKRKFDKQHSTSSEETQMDKRIFLFTGIDIEVALQTIEARANNRYKVGVNGDGPAHSLYTIRRMLVDEKAAQQSEDGKIPQASRSVFDIILPIEVQEANIEETKDAGGGTVIYPDKLRRTLIDTAINAIKSGSS